MNSFLQPLLADLQRVWGALSRAQKGLFIGVALASVIAAVMLMAWAQSPDFQPLYTNLEDADAGSIISELQTNHVPYQLSPDGKRISVPGQRVAELRLLMAQKGLPSGGGQLGYNELFDKGQVFGQTDAVQRLNMQRALQGELARTIKAMAGVDNARVSLALPERSLYGQEEAATEPTATVMLKLRAGAQISRDQAQTIVHLVAKSVERLKESNVVVADTNGHNYSQDLNLGDSGSELSAGQQDVRRTFELGLRKNLQAMLDKVLGPNGSVVQVQADFDFNQVELAQDVYKPVLQSRDGTASGLVRSTRETLEQYAGRNPGTGGAPGTSTNIPTYQATDSAAGGFGDYRHSERTTNYELNHEVKKQVKPPAELRRLSVSVAVNDEIPDDKRQALQDMIAAAAGIDANRGDTLAVVSIPFNEKAIKEAAKQIQDDDNKANLLNIAKIVGAVAVAIVALLLLRRGLRAREDELFESVPMTLEKPGITVSELGVIGEEDRRTHLQREISKVVKTQPQEVARLVRTWMMEDD